MQAIVAGEQHYTVSGTGYAPRGQIFSDEQPVTPAQAPVLRECLIAGLLCNDSALVERDGRWLVKGDPTEGALITVAHKADLSPQSLEQELPHIDVIPFESQHQYMVTRHRQTAGAANIVYMKGAVEPILAERAVHDELLHGPLSDVPERADAEYPGEADRV